MDPYDQYYHTGVARELEELKDRMRYYPFSGSDFDIIDRSVASIQRLLQLVLEKDKEPYKATTYYAGFTAGFNAQGMSECALSFEEFKERETIFDDIYIKPRYGYNSPHYINAVQYAEQIGARVPEEAWDALQAGIEEWDDVLTSFGYKDKQGLVLNIEFTKDGNLTKFDFRPAFIARPALDPETVSFFDPDTGATMDIPKECVCNRGGSSNVPDPDEDVEEKFIDMFSEVVAQIFSDVEPVEYDVVTEAMDQIEDAIFSIEDDELKMRVAVELLSTLDDLEGVEETTIPVAHTDFFKMTHELLENRKIISMLKQAIEDHKLGIESQALGNVAANKELWRYLNV